MEINNAIDKAWNMHSRSVPEDCYDISEYDWVIGNQVMLKENFSDAFREALDQLFEKVKHGDAEHQAWLKAEFENFLKS